MIPGVQIAMGGREWIVPPLTLGQMRRLLPQIMRLKDFGAGLGGEEIEVIVELVTAALKRNYPDMTAEEVEELVDLGNARHVVQAILTGSGLRPAGEERPAAMPNGVCADYTASSPPAADTPSPSS
ncbi:MAG TPA: hypothetical protein VFA12_19730, partial [Stellaceae bacterium]|nr:hypothetical protein [Stellaceae bacterium]